MDFLSPARSDLSGTGKRRVLMSTLLVKVEATPPRKRMLRCMKMSFGMAERHRKAPAVLRVEHGALPATPPPEFYSGKGRGRSGKERSRKKGTATSTLLCGGLHRMVSIS